MEKHKVEVLVADDEPEMRNVLSSVLRSIDYTNIRQASDGDEALRIIGQQTPPVQVAFLDINMPGQNGIDVLKKAKEVNPKCFCVIVSAHSAVENVKTALLAGARGFVVKPYSAKKILDVLVKFEQGKV